MIQFTMFKKIINLSILSKLSKKIILIWLAPVILRDFFAPVSSLVNVYAICLSCLISNVIKLTRKPGSMPRLTS
jgi:hypothetical protein